MSNFDDPLFGAIPDRIKLSRAQIAYVVARVEFPAILKVRDDAYIVEFQDRIRKAYPFLERVETVSGIFSAVPSEGGATDVHWHFRSVDKQWRVVLTSNSITLETNGYDGHSDFIQRFGSVLSALTDTIQPAVMTRVGYRYVNRLREAEDLADISKLVRQNLIGMAGAEIRENVIQSIAQSTCKTKEGYVVVHWGLLPPQASISDLMEQLDSNSWILDVDAYTDKLSTDEFAVDQAVDVLDQLSDRSYAFFRWAITEEFLKRFG